MGLSEEAKQRKVAYIGKYQKAVYVNISFKLRKVEDKTILDYLKGIPNKSEFIKDLIKKQMGK